jgi:sortase B
MQNNKKTLYTVLTVVFLIIFAISVGVMVRNYLVEKRANEIYDQMVEDSTVVTEEASSTEVVSETQTEVEEVDILTQLGITIPEKDLNWEELYAQNEDIYAWIYIPNTQVDYPILQHPTELNYYIDYNIDGTKGYPGCICTQYYNGKEFKDPNTIVYGHNMKNGTMFKTLHNFEDADFFDENQYVYIYTPDITYVYEIFAACSVSDTHLMVAYNFWDAASFNSFVSDITSARGMTNQVREGVLPVYGDYLLTLSTCISGQSDKRWIVVGKRIN